VQEVETCAILEIAVMVSDGDLVRQETRGAESTTSDAPADQGRVIEVTILQTQPSVSDLVPSQGPSLVIHHPEPVLAGMNAWCVEQHGKSGLTQRVRASAITLAEAEAAVLSFVARHTQPQAAQLAGNSVHVDLAFLRRYMPSLAAHLSYRIVDVSSVRELAKRWYPAEMRRAPRKACEHTALADIRESLAELRWLRKTVFKAPRG